MEKISKIFALIIDRTQGGSGEGGNCKVVAFVRNNELEQDPVVIASFFTTNSMIFLNKIYSEIPRLTSNQLVELTVKNFNNEVDEGKNIYVGIKNAKTVGSIVIDIPNEYFKENHIEIVQINKYLELNKYLDLDLGYFYLFDSRMLYGPFRINNRILESINGKNVNSFEYYSDGLIEVEGYDYSYIINKPTKSVKILDCMTAPQLINFLKDQLTIDRAEINIIKKTIDQILSLNEEKSELDTIRLSRSTNVLNSIILSYEELKKLSTKDHFWSKMIKQQLDENKEQLKNEVMADIQSDISEKKKVKNDIINQIKEKHLEIESLNRSIAELSNQYNKILKNKEELILSIQIASGSHQKQVNNQPFYEVIKSSAADKYKDLEEFYDQCETKVKNKKELKETLYILKENKFIIGNSTELVINAIQHLGSYQIMLQNAEPDWLKYSFLEKNGFGEFTSSAKAHPDLPFFFVLQDFNIASFECYGKPILDVVNHVRQNIPGTPSKWPSNLYFIMIKIQSEIEDFGFELNDSSFTNWHFLPVGIEYKMQNIKSDYGINLEKLEIHHQYSDYRVNYLTQ